MFSLPSVLRVMTITRTITVAAGVFAPGHLGELTRHVPFELVDAVLEETRTRERRLRELPSRVGVYFVLALGLFPRLGYREVWGKLTAGAGRARAWPCPSAEGAAGPAPAPRRRRRCKALFEVLAGPAAQPSTPGVRFGRYRTVAFDGCTSIKVPDTAREPGLAGQAEGRARRHRLPGDRADDPGARPAPGR